MPIDGVFAAQDYDPDRFEDGVTPRVPDGGVELARTNAILEQWLRILEPDGSPVGWDPLTPPEDEGYDVYLGETIASMSRYNTSPIDSLDDAYQFNKGVTGGGSPPNRQTPDIAVLQTDPEQPQTRKVAPDFVGYPTGTYLAAKTIVGKRRRTHTRLTPYTEFTISASEGSGKALEWQATQDLPKEAYGEGLWLSEPVEEGGNPDPSTMRLQAVRPKGGRTYTTRGPLKLGSHARKPPKFNETKVGKPKKLKWGQDMRIRGGLGHDLQPMRLKSGIVVTTAQGESVLSDLSDPINIIREREGHGVMYHPKKLHPDASGYKIFVQVDDVDNPPWYQLIRTEKGDKFRRFAHGKQTNLRPVLFGYKDTGEGKVTDPAMPAEWQPKLGQTTITEDLTENETDVSVQSNGSFPSSAPYDIKIGHEVMTVVSGAGSNTWTVRRAQAGTKKATHSSGDKVAEDLTVEKRRKLNEHQNRHFWLLAQADPPTEDSTGLEDPTGDIDAPIPVGLSRPGAGTWYVAYSRRFDGKPTQASRPKKVTIAADEVIELVFPPRVNKITNALYGQLNQKGIPTNWTFTKQDGTTTYVAKDAQMEVRPGQLYLSTSGAPVANDRYPRAVSWDTTDIEGTIKSADRDRIERIRCTLEVQGYGSGRAYVEVVQFNDSFTQIGALTLDTLSENGFVYIDKSVGDSLLEPTPDVWLHENCAYIGIRWGIENGASADRNLKVGVYNLFWHPFDAHPRRFEERAQPDELWVPSNDPATPIPGSHVLAIGKAPDTAGDVQSAPTPLDDINHSETAVPIGSGGMPTGWGQPVETNPGVNSEATIVDNIALVTKGSATFGGVGNDVARFRSDGLQALNHNFFDRDYTSVWPGGNALALRFIIHVQRLPSKSGRSVQIAAITTESQAPMAWFQIWHDGTLNLHTFNYQFTERTANVLNNLQDGDIVEAELIVGGGGSTAGIASTRVGVNGATPSAGGYISGVDWYGTSPNASGAENSKRFPRRVMYGGFSENHPDQRWTFNFDDVVPTLSGYAGVIAPPAQGPTPMPDRPQRLAGDYRDTAPDGETINQGYAFYLRSDALEGVWMGHETEEFYVKPGVQRTAAVFMKPQDFPEGQRIFVLAAYNENGDRVEIDCLSEQVDANKVANLTPGWFEYWMAYTPPEGYFRLRWEHEGTTGGTYVWQEPVDAIGNLDTLAERDAARVEARAVEAKFSVLLEARVPGQEGTNMENGWKEERKAIIVSSQIPDELQETGFDPISWQARSSDKTDVWTTFSSDEDLIPDLRYVELEVTLRGDGINTPVVPAGGASLIYSTYQPILLRDNRTSLYGGVLVGGDSDSNLPRRVNRHEYDTEAVGGRALPRAVSDRIGRLGAYAVRVYTREGQDELGDNMAVVDVGDIADVSEWFIEDWFENLYHRCRFYAPGDWEPELDFEFLERRQEELTGLRIPRVMEIEATQVLETHYLEFSPNGTP
jgi:hypothetical protein